MASNSKSRKSGKRTPRPSLDDSIMEHMNDGFSESRQTSEIWGLLRALLKHHEPHLTDDLVLQIRDIADSRSVERLMKLQLLDPRCYESAAAYSAAASVISFLKKYPFGKVAGLDPEGTASESCARAEKLCRITNRRLQFFDSRGFRLERKRPGMFDVLNVARNLIANWLGPLDLNEIYDQCGHGPGGVIGVSGDRTTAYYKFAAPSYTVTPGALLLAQAAILADKPWCRQLVKPPVGPPSREVPTILEETDPPTLQESLTAIRARLELVDYNKVTFVPKTAKTHRAIAIEPFMNIFLQLGVGRVLARKLSRIGLNLRDQTLNQRLAQHGSHNWASADSLVTLDLSMASDTLTYELVRMLLPPDWFDFLLRLRSPYGEMPDGTKVHWAKFSSMGNGYTFPLESMIFYALSRAVGKRCGVHKDGISVYGDDIIVRRGMALRLIETLEFCGFKINTEKSYLAGPFRESCGTDWFEGSDVRPVHLTRCIRGPRDLIFLCNRFGGMVGAEVHGVSAYSYSRLPAVIRENLLGPPCVEAEGHIFASWDFAQKSKLVLWNRDFQSWDYPTIKSSAREHGGGYGNRLLQALSILGRVENADEGGMFTDHKPSQLSETWLRRLYLHQSNGEAPPVWLVNGLTVDPVKRFAVARRKSVRYSLSSSTSCGWRSLRAAT